MAVHASSPSYSGDWRGRITWAQDLEPTVSYDCTTALQPKQQSETLSLKIKLKNKNKRYRHVSVGEENVLCSNKNLPWDSSAPAPDWARLFVLADLFRLGLEYIHKLSLLSHVKYQNSNFTWIEKIYILSRHPNVKWEIALNIMCQKKYKMLFSTLFWSIYKNSICSLI